MSPKRNPLFYYDCRPSVASRGTLTINGLWDQVYSDLVRAIWFRNLKSKIPNLKSKTSNLKSEISNLESEILDLLSQEKKNALCII